MREREKLRPSTESEELFRLVAENVDDFAIFAIDLDGDVVSWNPGVERLLGYSEEEWIGLNACYIFTPEDNDQNACQRELTLAAERGRAEDRRWHLRKDGSRFYANGLMMALKDDAGALRGFAKIMRDETARKRAEDNLREREERYRSVARATSDAVWDWDLVTNAVVWNEGVTTLFGYQLGEVGADATWWSENIHPEDRGRVVAGIHTVIDDGGQWRWSDEYRYLKSDGTYAIVLDRGYCLRDEQGKAVRMVGGMQNVTERKKSEEALRVSRERLDLVLNSSDLGLWYCDLPFDELNWSERTKNHFWLPADARVTIDLFFERLHPDDRERTRRAIERSIETRTGYNIEYRTVDPEGGGSKWIRAFGRGFYDGQDQPYRFDGITVDITEAKRAGEERERLLIEAQESNRLKDEFLATLSHELRTPLTSVLGWSRLLQMNNFDESATAHALETIQRNAQAQVQLIDDLLDVSRIVTGKLRLDVRAVDLAKVIAMAADTARPAAEAKSIRLQTLLDPHAGPISGDPDRLQQVVWNLISNAIKFTPKGGRVQVRLERVDSHIEITVSDTGKGIEPEFLPHVFDRFRQADQTTARTHGGLGLGLAIVRQLVELHGGTVQAESEGEGQGATFVVSLPLLPMRAESTNDGPRVHPAAHDGAASLDRPPELRGVRVLVVDDETDTRELLRAVLSSHGAEVLVAASAEEAVAAIEKEHLHVLVTDIGMPEEDGYDLIRRVRTLEAGRSGGDGDGARVPAVALTAYARVEDRVRALNAGFQVHVPKPIEPIELVAVVASLAGRTGAV